MKTEIKVLFFKQYLGIPQIEIQIKILNTPTNIGLFRFHKDLFLIAWLLFVNANYRQVILQILKLYKN